MGSILHLYQPLTNTSIEQHLRPFQENELEKNNILVYIFWFNILLANHHQMEGISCLCHISGVCQNFVLRNKRDSIAVKKKLIMDADIIKTFMIFPSLSARY